MTHSISTTIETVTVEEDMEVTSTAELKRCFLKYLASEGNELTHASEADRKCQAKETLMKAMQDIWGITAAHEDLRLLQAGIDPVSFALAALTNPYDRYVLPEPCISKYVDWVEGRGAYARQTVCTTEGSLDVAAIEAAITSQTKAVLISTPNVVTGCMEDADRLTSLISMLKSKEAYFDHPIYLIQDLRYLDFVEDKQSLPWLPSSYEHTLVCYSSACAQEALGESFGMIYTSSQMKEAEQIQHAFSGVQALLSYGSTTSFSQLFFLESAGVDELSQNKQSYKQSIVQALDAKALEYRLSESVPRVLVKLSRDQAEALQQALCGQQADALVCLTSLESHGMPGWISLDCRGVEVPVERIVAAFKQL